MHERRTTRDLLADPRPIAGADDAPITVDGLASTSLETLQKMRSDKVSEANKLADTGERLDRDGRKVMRQALADVSVLSETIAEREGDEQAIKAVRQAAEDEQARSAARRENARQPIYANGGKARSEVLEAKTPGEMFTESDSYTGWLKRFPDGAPARGSGAVESDSVLIPNMSELLGMRNATKSIKARAIVTAGAAVAGEMVRNDYLGLLEPGLQRPLTIRDLLTVIPTSVDAVDYVKELTRVAGAAAVAEATASAGATGLKPEGGLTFSVVTATVKTIAEWVAATKRILGDAPALRAYIDQYLLYDLALELEDQILTGDGIGENFTGLLNVAGVQTLAAPVAPASNLDNIRKAITLIELNSRARPSAVVMHPTDAQNLDLLKVNNEANHFAGAGPFAGYPMAASIWGLPRVVSDGLTAGTALVGDFRRAVLFDREQSTISVGTINDDFVRNIVRVLAEMRAGFGVIRPSAFVKVTLA